MTKKITSAVSEKEGREEINPRSMPGNSVNLKVPHQRMSQREAAQDSGETVHEFSWKLFPKDFETHYYEKDLPVFIKKIRSEIMQLTLETAGHAIGVSKNHMARIEAGGTRISTSSMILFFDLVESWLIQENKEWYELGEHQVDFLIPMPYKKLRGWCFGRPVEWPITASQPLLVDNAIPPLLKGTYQNYRNRPELLTPAAEYANRTLSDRNKILSGDLESQTNSQRQYIERAYQIIKDATKKKSVAVLESWAVIARQKRRAPLLSPNTESRLNDEIKTKTLEINRRLNEIRELENKIMLLEQELDKEAERLENSEKLIRVYEHQIRHNKKMADQGLHEAIMGLPAARPEEWSSEDVPEYLKEEIYHELHETLCDADDGSDITEDPRYE